MDLARASRHVFHLLFVWAAPLLFNFEQEVASPMPAQEVRTSLTDCVQVLDPNTDRTKTLHDRFLRAIYFCCASHSIQYSET